MKLSAEASGPLSSRPMRHRRGWVALSGVVALAFFFPEASHVRADESKREELRREIERLLTDLASELRDVPGDSSPSDVERTLAYAGQVHDKARELKGHAEGNSDAQRMADYYPDFARRYQEAGRALREMKASHRKLDELPRKCEDTTKELMARVRTFTDVHDPSGAEEVPRLARELGKVGKDALELAERTRYELATWYDRVDDFGESEGKWSDVRSYLHAAGRAIYEHVQRQQDQMKRDDVCGALAKEDRNPLIEEAMRKLFEGKKGIDTLYEAMDRQAGELAALFDGLVSDSDDSDLRKAVSKLDEIDQLLGQLDRVRGNDGEARRRLEAWRPIVRATRDAFPTWSLSSSRSFAWTAPPSAAARAATSSPRRFAATWIVATPKASPCCPPRPAPWPSRSRTPWPRWRSSTR